MAFERHITLKELLLLAITKTTLDLNMGPEAFVTLRRRLDTSFSASAKIHRICTYFCPDNFRSSDQFMAQYSNIQRIAKLSRRMAHQLFNKDSESIVKMMGSWAKIKHSGFIYEFENFKGYLKARVGRTFTRAETSHPLPLSPDK